MRKSIFFIIIFILFTLSKLFAQFRNPLDIPMYLSGGFAELRSNHFHSGLDIKTQNVEGFPIFVVADGWVSRIKVSPWGYGNAIYVTHNNGYTSVYAHLSRYNDLIQQFVENLEYKKESFAIDYSLQKGEIVLQKGDTIGFTGNSGSSGGPHLHFELRNTKTQKPLNPLRFPFAIVDTIAPKFKALFIFDDKGVRRFPVNFAATGYFTSPETLEVFNNFDFGILTRDVSNGSENPLGINKISLYENENLVYEYDNQSFSFSESRYINSHIWYGMYRKEGIRVQKLWKDYGSRLSVYNLPKKKGTQFKNKEIVSVLIKIFDVKGNVSHLQFYVKQNLTKKIQSRFIVKNEHQILMPYNKANHFEQGDLTIDIPKGALYDTIIFDYQLIKNELFLGGGIYHINSDTVSLHKKMIVSLNLSDDLKKWGRKLLFVRVKNKKIKNAISTQIKEGKLQMRIRRFGDYSLALDTVAPKIKEITKEKTLVLNSSIQFKISDNLSGITKYIGRIDKQWVLFRYDPKNNLLWYQIDKRLSKKNTMRHLSLKVLDAAGNISVLEKDFVY